MNHRQMRELAPGYASEADGLNEVRWHHILEQFDDANIYQTWSYEAERSGRHNVSRLVLTRRGEIAAIAQARLVMLPLAGPGIAYIRWGPLWRARDSEPPIEAFRQAVRALRNEYAVRRGLALRLYPILFDDDAPRFLPVLEEEGFTWLGREKRDRTILIDLNRSLDDLRGGLRPHWRRQLKLATQEGLEIVEGYDDGLYDVFRGIYHDMVARKGFAQPDDIDAFRLIQSVLPEKLKLKIMLCKAGDSVCAGLVCSVIGKTAIYLLGATSSTGMQSRGSYLLHWKLIEWLKQKQVSVYDLNGIDPVGNPGTYRFKNDLCGQNGKDVFFLGRFDAYPNILSEVGVTSAYTLRRTYRALKNAARMPHSRFLNS